MGCNLVTEDRQSGLNSLP